MFTRITDDLNIISKLADEPNIDDGLSASQLKEKFDEVGNTLKTRVNETLGELESSNSASNIGARPIYIDDVSDENVQAKLELLQEELEDITQEGVADNSITQAKIEGTYEATLAKKNGTLQTGLNAEMLGGVALDNLMSNLIEIGSYTGDGALIAREINLGYKPRAVILGRQSYVTDYYNGDSSPKGVAFMLITNEGIYEKYRANSRDYDGTHTLSDNGFTIDRLYANSSYQMSSSMNNNNEKYVYIAIK